MIDLDATLRPLIDTAPEPPGVTPRHRRRRIALVAAAAALVTIAAGAAGVAVFTDRDRPGVLTLAPDTYGVTLLDGTQLEIETDVELDEPVFHAGLILDGITNGGVNVDVARAANGEWELRYQDEQLTAPEREQVRSLLQTREVDGFLVLDATSPMRVGPTDAPDVDFGPIAVLTSGLDFCPDQIVHDAESGTWWCDGGLRLHADDPDFDPGRVQLRRVHGPAIFQSPLDGRTAPFVGRARDHVVVWGGAEGDAAGSGAPIFDGAVLDTRTDRWTAIPPAPIVVADTTAAVVAPDGGLYVVADGDHDSAVYDTSNNEWRALEPAPIPTSDGELNAAWATGRLVVWQWDPEPAAAVLDLESETWRAVDPPPLDRRYGEGAVWTGSEVIVWGGQRFDNTPLRDGAAFDPNTNSWRTIAEAPAVDEHLPYYSGLLAPSVGWSGREMLVWGWTHQSLGENTEGLAYNPATDAWRRLADAPIEPRDSCECAGGEDAVIADDGTMLVWTGNLDRRGAFVLRYDPKTDTWTTVSGPFAGSDLGRVVTTERELLVWGPQRRVSL